MDKSKELLEKLDKISENEPVSPAIDEKPSVELIFSDVYQSNKEEIDKEKDLTFNLMQPDYRNEWASTFQKIMSDGNYDQVDKEIFSEINKLLQDTDNNSSYNAYPQNLNTDVNNVINKSTAKGAEPSAAGQGLINKMLSGVKPSEIEEKKPPKMGRR